MLLVDEVRRCPRKDWRGSGVALDCNVPGANTERAASPGSLLPSLWPILWW